MKIGTVRQHLALVAITVGGCATAPQEVRVPPQVTYQVRPMYPEAMKQARLGGEVLVDFIVSPEGIPVSLRVLKSSRKEFDAAALAAVQTWRFKPATVNGRPVSTHLSVPIIFTPDEK